MAAGQALALLALGTKGLGLLEDLSRHARIDLVVTATPSGTSEPGPAALRAAAPDGTTVVEARTPDLDALLAAHPEVGLVLTVGWQRMLAPPRAAPLVVLHDSLLPDLRGFAPTVTALIEGRPRLGVTAIVPTDRVDAGPVLAQHAVEVSHPMRIAAALEALRPCYLACALDVIARAGTGALDGDAQVEEDATYSVWRDDEDYDLDLTLDAERIVRTVLALGSPYPGARVRLDGAEVRVMDAVTVDDVPFVHRQPGKVWRLAADGVDVVCGRGMVRLRDLRDAEGRPIVVSRLRTRLT